MALRLALISPRNTVSSGTITQVSSMHCPFQQGSGGRGSTNTIGSEVTSAEHVDRDAQDQIHVIDLRKGQTESPV